MTGKSRRVSAAAVRRAREQLVAERAAPSQPLPEEFLTWIEEGYQPKADLQPLWPEPLLPFVKQALTRV
jgi:hypothetical protein